MLVEGRKEGQREHFEYEPVQFSTPFANTASIMHYRVLKIATLSVAKPAEWYGN